MYERVLVPVDGSATSNQGLEEAIKLARLTGAKIGYPSAVSNAAYAMTWQQLAALLEQAFTTGNDR